MKVLVVLGVWLLVAVSAATNLPEGRDYCCGQGIKDVPPSAWKNMCVSLVEMTDIMIKEAHKEIGETRGIEITPDVALQIKINEFTKATIRCVPNNQLYPYVHMMIDDLHNIIAKYPTPKNVLKNITEAEVMLIRQLDTLESAVNDAGSKLEPKIRTRVEEFSKASVEKAVKVFEHNLKQAESNAKIFTSMDLNEVIDKLVESIHKCVPIKQTDFESGLKCRQNVKTVASDLRDKIRNLRIMGQIEYVAPEQSLRRLMMDITAEGHDLEHLIRNDKLERQLKGE